MEAVYKTWKNATFCHGINNDNPNNVLYTSAFNLSYSSSSFSSSAYPNLRDSQQIQNQPPLLPLPVSKPHQNNTTKINNITKSLKKSGVITKGQQKFKHQIVLSNSLNNRLGPDPMDVLKFLFSSSSDFKNNHHMTKFSGTVASTVLSPPPSSFPLPTFSLRPKLCCNAQVAATVGIDAGATDSLRRILRIR